MIRTIATVWLKEVVENLRDRRTLFSALVFGPVSGPLLFAVLMSLTLDRVVTSVDERIALVVSGEKRAPNLVSFLKQHGVDVSSMELTLESAQSSVRNRKHAVVLMIPAEYPGRFKAGQPAPVLLFSDRSDDKNGKYVREVQALLEAYSGQVGAMRLFARGIDPKVIRPVVIDHVDVSTPAGRALVLLGTITYFVLFSMLMGGLYLTIDATAGERERGSLEVLFTAPAPRQALIYGKILAACAFMLLSLAITIAGFCVSLPLIPLESLGMSANIGVGVGAKLFAIAAPFTVFGAALMTVVAAFTRTYKEAQTYLNLVLVFPTLPIVFAGLYALKSSNTLMTIPSLSQHLLMTAVLRDEPIPPLQLGISIGVTLVSGLLLAWIAGRLYRREAILG